MFAPGASQGNQPVLLGGTKFPLGVQRLQGPAQVSPGLGGLDHVIHQAAASGHIRIGERFAIEFDQLIPPLPFVFRGVDLMAKHDFRSTFGSHDCDFRRRPGHNPVRPQVLTAHPDVSSAVGFAYHDRYLWDGCRRVGEQDFCSMPNDAAVLLLDSGQKSGYIDKRQQRNVEGIAESNEAGHFIGCVDVERSCEYARLIGDDPRRAPCRRPKPITAFWANPGWISKKSQWSSKRLSKVRTS